MWGIIPAAGRGSRIQPLAFSKELLPVGSCIDNGVERPCAVSEYLVERMILGGASKICFVISPGKSDILGYYGSGYGEAAITYVVQPRATGLCDAFFRAAPLIAANELVTVGLPDTVWFPASALTTLQASCKLCATAGCDGDEGQTPCVRSSPLRRWLPWSLARRRCMQR